MMPPPPPPSSRSNPAQGLTLPMSSRQGNRQQHQNAPQARERLQVDMPPVQQPEALGAKTQQGTLRTQASSSTEMQANSALQPSQRPVLISTSSNRMPPGSQRFAFPITSTGTTSQRFVPPTHSSSHRFDVGTASGSGSRAPRAAYMGPGGQRMPFIPAVQAGYE